MLPDDIIQLIINSIVQKKDVSKLSMTNKRNNILVKKYYYGNLNKIHTTLAKWNKTFPNAKYANIREGIFIIDSEFKYLEKVKVLDMALCSHRSINDHSFRYLLNIQDLNLQGCCNPWERKYHFTDKMFDYLLNLKRFYIDHNNLITNNGIQKLTKLTDLTLHCCSEISNDGLANLTNLEKLSIHNLDKLTDEVFDLLINIKDLEIMDGNITDKGITKLINIEKIQLVTLCPNSIRCKDYNLLTKLNKLSLYVNNITDEDLINCSNIKELLLFQCKINGSGLQYLTNCENLSIFECHIIDDNLGNLYKLNLLKQINIYRCRLITDNKKSELISVYGNKFKTDTTYY